MGNLLEMTRKKADLKKIEDKVSWLLNTSSHLRNCDKCLIKYYHYQFDGYRGELSRVVIHTLTAEESITRCRRKLQMKGMFLPTDPEVIEARQKNQKAFKAYAVS